MSYSRRRDSHSSAWDGHSGVKRIQRVHIQSRHIRHCVFVVFVYVVVRLTTAFGGATETQDSDGGTAPDPFPMRATPGFRPFSKVTTHPP